jgi:response regulator NasT
MNQCLRIVAADDDPDARHALAAALRALGHDVDAAARTGRQLIERCRVVRPDLIVADIDMPRLDGLAAVAEVSRERPTPVVVVSAYHDLELQQHARHQCVMAYLVKPVGAEDLGPAISLAWWRFGLFQGVHREATGLHAAPGLLQAQEERKAIERAKAVLMKLGRLDEPEAYRRLLRLASAKHREVLDIAQMILTAEEAFISGEQQ